MGAQGIKGAKGERRSVIHALRVFIYTRKGTAAAGLLGFLVEGWRGRGQLGKANWTSARSERQSMLKLRTHAMKTETCGGKFMAKLEAAPVVNEMKIIWNEINAINYAKRSKEKKLEHQLKTEIEMERQAANGGRREGKSRRRRQRRSNRRLPSFQVSSAASVLPASPQVRLLSLSLSRGPVLLLARTSCTTLTWQQQWLHHPATSNKLYGNTCRKHSSLQLILNIKVLI